MLTLRLPIISSLYIYIARLSSIFENFKLQGLRTLLLRFLARVSPIVTPSSTMLHPNCQQNTYLDQPRP